MSAFHASGLLEPRDAADRMNRMYRLQRHIYDLTRRYYLLGRDQLLDNLSLDSDAKVLEIACGTGRNLVQAAKRYPEAQFFGIDISTEMLASASSAIRRHDLADRVSVTVADATAFDPQSLFQVDTFDSIFISYSLSMIPGWRCVILAAVESLKPGGHLHLVDFGPMERLPGFMRRAMVRWLALFDVTPHKDLELVLTDIADNAGHTVRFERRLKGYVQSAVLQRRSSSGAR